MKTTLFAMAALSVLALALPAQSPPAGFTDQLMVSGLSSPCGFDFLPDGRMLICERSSHNIKVATQAGAVGTLGNVGGVTNGSERGLLGICRHWDWPNVPNLFVVYSATNGKMRVSRFVVSGDLSNASSTNLTLGAEYIIINDGPDGAFNHNGGSVRFGVNNNLLVSLGEDANPCEAQNLASLQGCILRLDISALPTTGGGGPPTKALITPVGNPFTAMGANQGLIYTYGLRNPFRFTVDKLNGGLCVADVGQNVQEEVSIVSGGGQNMGWPWLEGSASFTSCGGSQPGSVPPISTYQHSGFGSLSVVTFGGVYRNVTGGMWSFGPAFEGDVFYHDYYDGQIRHVNWNGSSFTGTTTWATGYSGVSDALVGPDGAIWYVDQSGNQVRRVRPTTPNTSDVISIVSGDGQCVNAGTNLLAPMVVSLVDNVGVPLAATTVNFSVTTGSFTLASGSVLTDAGGMASVGGTATTAWTTGQAITVQASSAGSNTVNFGHTWRGLRIVPLGPQFGLIVYHSQLNQGITLALETPPLGAPVLSLPFGDLWTNVISNPLPPTTAVFPVTTGGTVPTWNTMVTYPVPAQGVTATIQAIGLDTSKLGSFEAFFISNAENINL